MRVPTHRVTTRTPFALRSIPARARSRFPGPVGAARSRRLARPRPPRLTDRPLVDGRRFQRRGGPRRTVITPHRSGFHRGGHAGVDPGGPGRRGGTQDLGEALFEHAVLHRHPPRRTARTLAESLRRFPRIGRTRVARPYDPDRGGRPRHVPHRLPRCDAVGRPTAALSPTPCTRTRSPRSASAPPAAPRCAPGAECPGGHPPGSARRGCGGRGAANVVHDGETHTAVRPLGCVPPLRRWDP